MRCATSPTPCSIDATSKGVGGPIQHRANPLTQDQVFNLMFLNPNRLHQDCMTTDARLASSAEFFCQFVTVSNINLQVAHKSVETHQTKNLDLKHSNILQNYILHY